jgi:phage-related protein
VDNPTVRKIIIYGEDFWEFYNKQNSKVKDRINWTIRLVFEIRNIPDKYFKHIKGTDLYEIRIISGNNIYRVFCFFDKGNLVVVLNGFQKSLRKLPEIKLIEH